MIHTVKGFSVVNEAKVDIFLKLSCFFYGLMDVGSLISIPLPFLNPAWKSGSSWLMYCKTRLENFEHYFASVWDECNWAVVLTFFGIAFL